MRTSAVERHFLSVRRIYSNLLLPCECRQTLRTVRSIVRCISRVMADFTMADPILFLIHDYRRIPTALSRV
jgi:hypothetical protein